MVRRFCRGPKRGQVGAAAEREAKIVVDIKTRERNPVCPYYSSVRLYRHGPGETRQVLHSWSSGKKVYPELCRQPWRCRDCGHCFNDRAELLRPYCRIAKQTEQEALWQLNDRSFSQITRDLGVSYSSLRRLLEREIDGEVSSSLPLAEETFLGIDEHSFEHQEPIHTVTEVKKRQVLRILKDDHIATSEDFLTNIAKDKELCINLKESLPKAVEAFFREAKAVADHFHGGKLNVILERCPGLQALYWAKKKIRELYRQETREEAARVLDNLILNPKCADDGEMVRRETTLKRWREPILNYFDKRTTSGLTEGCNVMIKMLKRVSYGLRDPEVYCRKILLGFVPSRGCFHSI